MVEIWSSVPGFDRYFVSNQGRVASKKGDSYVPLKLHQTSGGYHKVRLSRSGKRHEFKVHRLICLVFLGPANGLQVNHLNAKKTDNRLENLEYVTDKQNKAHARSMGIYAGTFGEANGNSKLSDSDVARILAARSSGRTQQDVGVEFGVNRSCIGKLWRGQARIKQQTK